MLTRFYFAYNSKVMGQYGSDTLNTFSRPKDDTNQAKLK